MPSSNQNPVAILSPASTPSTPSTPSPLPPVEMMPPRRQCARQESQTVRFFPSAKVVEIRPLSEMSDDEINSAYYSKADYQANSCDITSTALAMRRGKSLDPTRQTDRGLEHLRTAQKLQRVQDQQDRHAFHVLRAHGIGATPQFIANLSSQFSKQSSLVAQRRAMKDEVEAVEIHDEGSEINLVSAIASRMQRQLSVDAVVTSGTEPPPKHLQVPNYM